MSESRYDGFPQVFLSGDKAKALAHLGRAKSLLSEVQKVREAMGTESYAKSIRLGDVEITAKCIGGLNSLYVHAPQGGEVKRKDVGYKYPVVLSGYINARRINTYIPDEEFYQQERDRKLATLPEGADPEEAELTAEEAELARFPTGMFAPTLTTVRAYGEYLEQQSVGPFLSKALHADAGARSPFAGYGLNEYLENGAELKYRAYRAVKGSVVTGALSACLQCALGLHESSKEALIQIPEFLAADEDRLLDYADKYPDIKFAREAYLQQIDEQRGFVSEYVSKWSQSCGLVRGYNQWWLVRVGVNRILARRLPIFVGSNLPEFAKHYRDLGLEALADFIVQYKGLPTGEGFPTGSGLDRLIETGEVLDITPDIMPFAEGGWYAPYETCSWSFSNDGYEAHNTAMRYVAAPLGEDVYEFRWASLFFEVNTDGRRETIKARAHINRTNRLYRPPYFQNFSLYQDLPIKVPSGYGGDVISLDVGTEDGGRQGSNRDERFNAVVWAGYIDGSLHTVSYYYNGLSSARTTEYGERPPLCPYSGAWEWGTKAGVDIMPPVMFTNVWDMRQPLDGSEVRNVLTSRKLGEFIAGGNFIPDVEWSYYYPYAVYHQNTKTWRYAADDLKARITLHMDRSFYTGSSLYTNASQVNFSDMHGTETVRGKWVGFGFRCLVGINMSVKPACVRATTAKEVMGICNQRCNFMATGTHSDTTNRHVCEFYDNQLCRDYVDIEPPARCSDVNKYLVGEATPEFIVPSSTTDASIKYSYSTTGFVYSAETPRGYRYEVRPGDMDVGTEIGSASPNPWTGDVNKTASTRNCVGYTYACFSRHLLGTLGYGRIGGLHTGDDTLNPNITFVGVLEDG